MFTRKTASLILLAVPAVLFAQNATAPAALVTTRPLPSVPMTNPTAFAGGPRAAASSGLFTPARNANNTHPGPARAMITPRSSYPAQRVPVPLPEQTAGSTVALVAPSVPRPDPPLMVPPAQPAPKTDPAALAAVEFQQGKLTVDAKNADLGRILRLIGVKTGAAIEIAPEIAAEPVVVHLGPGSPNEVLTALLSSPRIDFIIMGSEEQGEVKSVIVSRRAALGREPMVQSIAPPPKQVDNTPGRGEQEEEQQQPQLPPQEERPPQ